MQQIQHRKVITDITFAHLGSSIEAQKKRKNRCVQFFLQTLSAITGLHKLWLAG